MSRNGTLHANLAADSSAKLALPARRPLLESISNQTHLRRLSAAPRMVQREPPEVPLKEAKKEEAVEPIIGGAKLMASKAADTPQIKEAAIDAAMKLAAPIWARADKGEKAAMIGSGLVTGGIALGGMLGDPAGRKALSGMPIGAPLSLVPYALFSGFSYELPKSASDPMLLRLSFKADDYLELLRRKYPSVPKMSLSFDMTLSVSPDSKVTMPFGLVKFSPLPGVTLGAGYGVTTDFPTLIKPPGGDALVPYQYYPTPEAAAPRAGAAGFIAIDFAQIDSLRSIFAPLTLERDVGERK